MSSLDGGGKIILRNMLLGRWAAEKLGITGSDADAYASALVKSALDPQGSDVFTKIRKDFDAAGVAETDEQVLTVMTELTVRAGTQLQGKQGSSLDGAEVMLKRKLMSR